MYNVTGVNILTVQPWIYEFIIKDESDIFIGRFVCICQAWTPESPTMKAKFFNSAGFSIGQLPSLHSSWTPEKLQQDMLNELVHRKNLR